MGPTMNAAMQAIYGNAYSSTVFYAVLGSPDCGTPLIGSITAGNASLTSAVIQQAELTWDLASSGCGQTMGAAPSWWPSDAACGAWQPGSAGSTLSNHGLSLSMTPDPGFNSGGFSIPWGELLLALGFDPGSSSIGACVINLQILGSDGSMYYGSMQFNFCY